MNGHAIKELARAWATVAHDGVSRKGAGEPYINHCERVAGRVWGWYRQALAWLHDTVEDAEDPEAMFNAIKFIFGDDIARDTLLLSRLPQFNWLTKARVSVGLPPLDVLHGAKQSYPEWITSLAEGSNADVVAVKLADVEDNLKDIRDLPGMQSMEARYLKAKGTLLDSPYHERAT